MPIVFYITVKIQIDNTSTYEYSSYSPYARSHVWAPLFRNSGSAPEHGKSSDLYIVIYHSKYVEQVHLFGHIGK